MENYVRQPNIPKHLRLAVADYYKHQEEIVFGYVKYKIRFDSDTKLFFVDCYTKPSYYPSENITSINKNPALKQLLISTCKFDMDETDLINYIKAQKGMK